MRRTTGTRIRIHHPRFRGVSKRERECSAANVAVVDRSRAPALAVEGADQTHGRTPSEFEVRLAALRGPAPRSATVTLEAPHEGVEGPNLGDILNLTAQEAGGARAAQVELLGLGPDRLVDEVARISGRARQAKLPHLTMPHHHEVRPEDVSLRRLHGSIRAAVERGPEDFTGLLQTPGLGARTVRSLALVAQVIHGTPTRFSDPARFAMAHGGKDGHPFPVPLAVYDRTLGVLRDAVDAAKLGNDDRLAAMKRLDREARRLERLAEGESLEALIEEEWRASPSYRGRTVFGRAGEGRGRPPRAAARKPRRPGQLDLFA